MTESAPPELVQRPFDEAEDIRFARKLCDQFSVPHDVITVETPTMTACEVRHRIREHLAHIHQLPDSGAFMQPPSLITIDEIDNKRADIGLPFIARNPDDPAWAAAKHAIGSVPPVRSRVRKGKVQRFRLKSHKRVIDPGPSAKGLIKQHERAMRKAPKPAVSPEQMEARRKQATAAGDVGLAIAHRSSPARRAKLRNRR